MREVLFNMSYDTSYISDKYNGWTNYNTWLVNLWFSEVFDEIMVDEIKNYVENHIDEVISESYLNGFLGDVIGSFMNDVNWTEIESHYLPKENPHYGKRWDADFTSEDEEYVYPGDEVELTPEDIYSSVA